MKRATRRFVLSLASLGAATAMYATPAPAASMNPCNSGYTVCALGCSETVCYRNGCSSLVACEQSSQCGIGYAVTCY